jgi:hypothetical protein
MKNFNNKFRVKSHKSASNLSTLFMLGKGSEENKSLNVVSVIVVVAEDKSSNI